MSCNLFKKSIISDIPNSNSISFNISWLSGLIPSFESLSSGLWKPIIINQNQSQVTGIELLYPARTSASKSFSPCDCQDAQINPPELYQEESIIGLCSYCGSPPTGIKWKLYDNEGNSSPRDYNTSCCSGGCDTMLKVDDYIPKIPYLNNAYITGLVDWKHKLQFPACDNPGLGCESFASVSSLNTIQGSVLQLDWKIKETISEIEYDPFTSQHYNKYMHDKSYAKSKILSSTCGNFIMLSLPVSADTGCFYLQKYSKLQNLIFSSISGDTPNTTIPSVSDFQKVPYGFDQETYKNIFIKNEKLGSYWKWNHSSGILCWYRYYNTGIINDPRPIPGVDLYISPGDFFFATNDGPEPATDLTNPTGMVGLVQSCPSGLKIVNGSDVSCIIPSGSEFAYISSNIYDKFYTLYYKLLEILPTGDDIAKRAFTTAGILSTAPQYDEIIVDLLKRNNSYEYDINEYGRIDLLDSYMQSGTAFDSVSKLNFISNKEELFNTLASKYGAYLWIPPNTDTNISFTSSVDTTFAVNLDFNMSLKTSDTTWSAATCRPLTNCNGRSINKSFSYQQYIGYGQGSISTTTNEKTRYSYSCLSGEITQSNWAMYSNIYYNTSLIKSVYTFNGCSILSGIYPRIAEANNTVFCRDCDPYSSFYLIPNAEVVECGNHNSTSSFCYGTLARRFNNSPPQFAGDQQNRIERSLADGTKRWRRSYPALFFNPYIDSVAFHQNNGVFINSLPFQLDSFVGFESETSSPTTASNIYVRFNTKDIGLKLYNLSAEYLQTSSSSTYSCKRFPVKNTCKCLTIVSPDVISRPGDCDNPNINSINGSNIFTPGLSTRYAPRLKKYGGFSQNHLDTLFNGSITGGGSVPVLSAYVNPKTPFGCNSTASITLYNYTNTIWNINLQGISANTELYVTANEDIDLLGQRYQTIIYRDEGREDQVTNYYIRYEPILKSKKFTTKVTINDSAVLYAGQTIPLPDGVGSSLTIKLQNPFLAAAMQSRGGSPDAILYPPSGNLQNAFVFSNNGISSVGDPQRGDETSAITLNFTQKFNAHKLVFKVQPLQSMGSLQRGFFDPNKGLTTNNFGFTSISGNILYNHELTPDQAWPAGKIFYGDLNGRAINLINSLNEFNYHKKLRLYIQSNNKWYKYTGSNTGCYIINNIKYPGFPTFFEYNTETNTKHLPGLLLTPVRKHINFDFIRNNNWFGSEPLYNDSTIFPLSKNICYQNSATNNEIKIPGIRAYFLIPEKDPAIVTNLNSINDIASFTPPSEGFDFGSTIVFNDKTHWICVKPTLPNNRSSYIYTTFSYLDHNFSDTHINFDTINKEGYIYNSKKTCSYPIILYHDINNTLTRINGNSIIEKRIAVDYKTINGKSITNFNQEDLYIQPYTILKLQNIVPSTVKAFDLYPPTGASIIIGRINAPIAEPNPLLNNQYIPGKWGDVVDFNGKLVDAIVDAQHPIDSIYPKSTYKNIFQQILINNHSQTHIYNISGENSTYSITGIRDLDLQSPYYSILHKYAIGDHTKSYAANISSYHNFVPLMDLNLLNIPINPELTEKSGTIKIGNIASTHQPDNGYEPYGSGKFWINISSGSLMEGTFVPMEDFYTETLRIDQPIFWLDSVNQSEINLTPNTTYREQFRPTRIPNYSAGNNLFNNSSSYGMTTVDRSYPFWTYPIYGDLDDNTCDNSGCFGINASFLQSAELQLKAKYKVATGVGLAIPTENLSYALGYDAGVYNVLGNDSLVEIKRFSLKASNSIDNSSDSCSSAFILPSNYKATSSSPVFQSTITDSQISTLLDLPIDQVANEMLFRILYGQAQYVNRKMYFIDNPIYNKQDIIAYSEPRMTAEDIYSQILYNYDKNSSANFNINGSFSVNGVASVGSSTTITINDLILTITIANRSGKIYAILSSNISVPSIGTSLEVLLYENVQNTLEYTVQSIAGNADPPPPSSPNNNTTLALQGECIYYDSYSYYELSFGYEEPLTLPTNIVEFSKSCGIGWGNAFGEASMGQGGDCCCGFLGPCGGGCVALTITSWGPTNLRQYVCGAEQRGRVNFAAPVTRERPVPCNGLAYGYGISFGSCTPFNVGYCRKSNCQTCGETLQSETAINFEYQWQYCRTNFNTFGHIYRQVNQWDFTPIIVQPRPPDCYTYPVSGPFGDQCGNIPPGGSNQNGSTITTCTTYPVVGLTRSQMDDLRRNNILLGATAGTAYNCPDQSNGYLPPVPFERCFPVYGRGRACNDNPKSCTLQGCPDPFSSLSPSNGCSAGDCDFCYDPSSSYIMLNDNIDSGFEYPTGKCDKYCHFCGVGRMGSHNILSKNRVFLKTTTTNNPPYNPLCASTLCTISYTSSSITLTIGSKTICFSKSTLRCPKIEINSSMSQLNVVDSVQSSCDECIGSSMKVSIPEQKQLFVTKTENRRCLLSTFTTCSVNAPGLVGGGWQAYEHHASWLLQCGGGAPQYGCGQLGGRIYDNPDLTMDITYECLKGLACSVPARVAPYVVEETLWRLGTQLKNRFIYLAKGSAHIPTEDIIEGIVPGSVSSVIMESFNSGGVSITRDGDIQNDVSTTYAFYYTYNYIRPVTIQDIMRNDSSIICSVDSFEVNSTNTYSHCTNLPFPSQYASNLDLYRAHQFNLNKTGYLDGVSYTNTNPTYYQASSCDGAISCYYKHRVFICGVGDFCCMADLGVIKNEGIGTSCADINAPFTPVGPTL